MIGFCVGDVTPTYGKSIIGIPVSRWGRFPCALP